jgi:hypothetical protein
MFLLQYLIFVLLQINFFAYRNETQNRSESSTFLHEKS